MDELCVPDVLNVGPGLQQLSIIRRPDFAEGSCDSFESMEGVNLDSHVAAASHFPGFEETGFSTPAKRYYYKQKSWNVLEEGGSAVVEIVYWFNPNKGELESCVSKSLRMDTALDHSDGTPDVRADAYRETKALRRLAGVSGVVPFRDLIEGPNGSMHIILEKVAGAPLTNRMLCRNSELLGLTWLQIRLALKHLAQVLAECHKEGVVHGDVKPQNILSMRDKSGIMLVDFGSASIWDGRGWEYEGGTYMYTPQEMIRCLRSIPDGNSPLCMPVSGPHVDCWAYGVTAFKLLTCRSLFRPAKRTTPDIGSETDNAGSGMGNADWDAIRSIADLHADWEDVSGSRPVQVTFREDLQQLAGASEEFHRTGVDFLRALLEPNPAKRLTAQKALQHPFLSSAFHTVARDSYPPKVDSQIVLDKFIDPEMVAMFLKMAPKSAGDV